MLRQDFSGLPRVQQQQQQHEFVDNNPATPAQSQSSTKQHRVRMPATLSETLHEFHKVHAQIEKKQQQSPPLAREHYDSQPPDVLASVKLANSRLSVSVPWSHPDGHDKIKAFFRGHRGDTKDSHNQKKGAAPQYSGMIRDTTTSSSDGDPRKSGSKERNASSSTSINTVAPHLCNEIPGTSTSDLKPAPKLALPQDRRQQCTEEHVKLKERIPDGQRAYPTLTSSTMTPPAAADELQCTQRKLEEMQRLYTFEKQAHLWQRTQQLREDARLRESEDDITERTTQLLVDYESLVRLRDAASREHLERVLRSVTDEWMQCAASLEQTRSECEDALLVRIQTTLEEQQETLAKRMQEHLLSVARSTVDAERVHQTSMEAAILEQVESFKVEYRQILEQDMAERQRLMDEQMAHREVQWRSFLKEEHARMIATSEEVVGEANSRQLETLHIGMRDITVLREQLLRQHARRQAQVGHEYLAAYESLATDFTAYTEETAEYVQRLQHDYAGLIRALHDEVNRVSAEKQEAVRQIDQCRLQLAEAVAQQLHVVEEKINMRWQTRLEAEQETHRTALMRFTHIHEEALEKVRNASSAKEARLNEEHQQDRAVWENNIERQREQLTVAADDALRDSQAAVEKLQKDKDNLLLQLHQLKDQMRIDDLAHEATLRDARQAAEASYASQLSDLGATHDALLQQYKKKMETTHICDDGSGVASETAATALKRVVELEKELEEAQATCATKVKEAVGECAALWSARLQKCRQQQQSSLDALEQQHRELRAILLDEVQRREQVLEERAKAQLRAHQEELQDAIMKTKEDAQYTLERLERQHDAAKREVQEEAERRVRAAADALAAREKQLHIAEERWQRRRTKDNETALQQLAAQIAAQEANQLAELESREVSLRNERVEVAQQRITMEQDLRRTLLAEMEHQLAQRLGDSQEAWIRTLAAEMRQRFSLWQEFRAQELTSVQQTHCEEVRLLHEHYGAQIVAMQDLQQHHLSQELKDTRAREAAWTAARTASLDAYGKAASAKLQEVLRIEQSQWHTAQQQHAAERAVSIDAAAARVAEHFSVTEASRAQLENEVRSTYLPILEQQQAMTSTLLAEQRRLHEEAITQVRTASFTLMQEQVAQLEKYCDVREREHEGRLRELREAYERAASERMEHVRRISEEKIRELQQRCNEQASQLCDKETSLYLELRRIRDEVEEKLRAEYEKCISDFRGAIEEQNKCYVELQASLYARVQAEADRIQTRSDEKLAHFIEEHQKQLAELLLTREKALEEQQLRQQELLARLQADHEKHLTAQALELRQEHEAAEAALQPTSKAQQESMQTLLGEEREARRAAEKRAKTAARSASAVRVASEQQQAATFRALDEEYRGLLEQIHDDVQVEREEPARRCFEHEEQRFAAHVLRRHYGRRQSCYAQPPTQPSSSSLSSLVTDIPVVVTAPESLTPLAKKHTSHSASPSTVWTPGMQCPATSEGTPLPISVAGSLEPVTARPSHLHNGYEGKESRERFLGEAKQRLQQLWDVLEIPLDDQQSFLNYADILAREAPATDFHDALLQEQRRLETQLPLLEALTRREYVQRQLRLMANEPPLATLPTNQSHDPTLKRVSAGDDNVHVVSHISLPSSEYAFEGEEENPTVSAAASPPSNMRGEVEKMPYEQLQLQLQRLTERLRCDITRHENDYGQVFSVNGVRVMDRL